MKDLRPPKRPDSRADVPNAMDPQHGPKRRRPRPPRPTGETEKIAQRRLRALEFRKAGHTFRQIARALSVDVATAYADVQAELLELRSQTAQEAQNVRELELQRLDGMVSGLWPDVQAGEPRAVMAAVRVGERRARLLGLDAPTASNVNLKGQLDVTAQRQEIAELLGYATNDELRAINDARKTCQEIEARLVERRDALGARGTT